MSGDQDRDGDSGRFSSEYSEEEFIEALKENEPAGTSEIADTIGCHHKSAYKRLKQLEERGVVSSKQVGRSLIWTLE